MFEINLNKLRNVVNHLKLGDYGEVAIKRYVSTLRFFQHGSKKSDKICEIGPGGVIAYLAEDQNYICDAICSPREKHFDNYFEKKGIQIFNWDLNTELNKNNLSHMEGKYDCIFFLETLEHLNRWPEQVIEDIHYFLKPGGSLIISVPNLLRLNNRFRMLIGKSPKDPFRYSKDGRYHVREYSEEELRDFFALNHWKIVRSKHLFYLSKFVQFAIDWVPITKGFLGSIIILEVEKK